ncbi:hypothetical protein ABIB94_000286 [Bradyrhizobium sp. JR7.2]
MGTPARRGGIHAAALRRPRSILRHCERSEAIQAVSAEGFWIASSYQRKIALQFCRGLLAMTTEREAACRYDLLLPAAAATGAGLSCFWNINNGRKMTRP